MDIYSYKKSASLLVLGGLKFSPEAPDQISLRFATNLFKLSSSPKEGANCSIKVLLAF
jgi:hypothetical protein